jgi:hypothetical protein
LSSAAMPCWMLLITAISAARCSVSFKRRWRLVEEARVFQRHAHARRHCLQQPHLGFAEGMLALVVLEQQRAGPSGRRR